MSCSGIKNALYGKIKMMKYFYLSRHSITPEELEEAVFDQPGLWEHGRSGRYYLLGRTLSGRYIFAVFEYLKNGLARSITARDMTDTEHRRYERRLGK